MRGTKLPIVLVLTGLIVLALSFLAPSQVVVQSQYFRETVVPLAELSRWQKGPSHQKLAKEIEEAWQVARPQLLEELRNRLRAGDPYVLYDLQIATTNLLDYATTTDNLKMLDELCELYLVPLDYLKKLGDHQLWVCGGPACAVWEHPLYKNKEVQLASVQFVFLVSRAIRLCLETPHASTRTNVKSLISRYPDVIVKHLRRWLWGTGEERYFTVYGWNCADREMHNHQEMLELKRTLGLGSDPAYCSSYTDLDLLIGGVAAECRLIQKRRPDIIRGLNNRLLSDYLKLASDSMVSKFQATSLHDFTGKSVEGVDFDPGAWDSHPSYDYSGWISDQQPSARTRVSGAGWDISHAMRFAHVFPSFELLRKETRIGLAPDIQGKLANQIAYRVFNRDFRSPKFSNYFDGSLGCYNAAFHDGKLISGNAPHTLSFAIPMGGYLAWGRFHPDMRRLASAMYFYLFEEDLAPDDYAPFYRDRNSKNWKIMVLPSIYLGI